MPDVRLTVLGTGDAGGTPRIGCSCAACRTTVRGPTHAWIESDGTRLMLDAGGQLPEDPPDAVLLSHFHLDHCIGLVPLRWAVGDAWAVYAPRDELRSGVLFGDAGSIDFRHPEGPFSIGNIEVTPIALTHSAPTLGWFLEDGEGSLAYLLDTRGLPEASEAFLSERRIDILLLDCSFPPGHANTNHNDFDSAMATIDAIQPRRTLLVHVGHELDCWRYKSDQSLPENVEFAQDGQALAVVEGK